MKRFAVRSPVAFAVLVSLAVAAILGAFVLAIPQPVEDHLWFIVGYDAARYVIAVGLLTVLGCWGRAGFARLPTKRALLAFLPLLTLPALAMLGVRLGTHDPVLIVVIFETAFAAGFTEEALFRGVILRVLEPVGPMRAVALSSMLFGLIHTVNLIGGADPLYTGMQVVWATLLGFAFAATVLATGAIWPAIIIHFAINAISFLSSGRLVTREQPGRQEFLGLLVLIGIALLLAANGYRLLRQRQHRNVPVMTPAPTFH